MHPLIQQLLPEIILIVGAVLVLLLGLVRPRIEGAVVIALLFVAAAMIAAYPLGREQAEYGIVTLGEIQSGPLVWYARWVTLCVGALILLANRHVPSERERGEFVALILVSLAGISLVALANSLVLLFLALEMVSVPTYLLIGLSRRDIRAQEATGKYFFLGAFAAALTLYGFSFLYGVAGTTRMFADGLGDTSIHAALTVPTAMRDSFVIIGLVLALAGLAFKIAAVPLHFYAADVYQGAAAPVAGLLGFVPKFAGFLAIIRLLSLCDWSFAPQHGGVPNALFWLLWVLAAATMIVGNTLALWQQNVKRLLAYSSVAHSGYMLVALTAGPALLTSTEASPLRSGIAAVLFYIAVYGVMNLGAFAALSFFRKSGPDDPDDSIEALDDLAGAGRRYPWATLALAVCVLGLTGFPLTAGFLGKLYVFSAALASADPPSAADGGTSMYSAMLVLVVIGVLNSAIAAAYYLRILAACYLRKPAEGVSPSRCLMLQLSLALCALIVLGLFFKPDLVFNESQAASRWVAPANELRDATRAAITPVPSLNVKPAAPVAP